MTTAGNGPIGLSIQEQHVNDIKPGDLVRHKTGGPFMTVARSDQNNGMVRCVWYDSGRPGSEFFRTSDLVPVPRRVEEATADRHR